MRLRKKCAFSIDKISDMILLHEDVENLLHKSHKEKDPSPDRFLDDVFVYMKERPNIHKSLSPELTLQDFVAEFCAMHLKARVMHSVMTGKEKRPEVIESMREEIESYEKFSNKLKGQRANEDDYERSVAIPTKKTGVVIFNTVEEQRKSIDESLKRIFTSDSAMA